MDDLEIKLRQDIGLLEWQIRDLLPLMDSYSREARINELHRVIAEYSQQAGVNGVSLEAINPDDITSRIAELKALGGKVANHE